MGEWEGMRLAHNVSMPTQLRYRSLVAWQRADDLFLRLHHLVKESFPEDERYVLSSQLRRAALSVPANIVEGTARSHHRETLQFLRISWSSLTEVGYYIHVARRLQYISETTGEGLEREIRQIAAPLLGLIRHEQRAKGKP
jgi:four helix bundle protein